MKRLKKYFKLPPKNVCIIYGVAIAVILIAFLSVYFTFGKQLTAFVSDTQHFNAWLAQYKSLSAVIFILISVRFKPLLKLSLPNRLKLPQAMHSALGADFFTVR